MDTVKDKRVVVVGSAPDSLAAVARLREQGARVTAIAELTRTLAETPDLMVLSATVSPRTPAVQALVAQQVPVIGELEFGFQQSVCLQIAVSGTNGKSTTVGLIEKLLANAHRPTLSAGTMERPISSVAGQTRELDFLTVEASAFQLEQTEFYRPIIAVLLNLVPDHLQSFGSLAEYVRATARLFRNQQPFDWAIIQSEALALLRSQNVKLPAKIITFSAENRRADLYVERGLLISRLPEWPGPLLDLSKCRLKGPHNAENILAALAVGRVLRIPLQEMVNVLKECPAPAHCCEPVATVNGVEFVNDSQAHNLDALRKALLAMTPGRAGEPNIWLIAGGRDQGAEFHDIGPLLSQRVKGTFLLGEAREKIRAAWSLFTPCTPVESLLEAVSQAAEKAVPGDVVLLSPACSSSDLFQNYQHRGEVYRQAVEHWTRSISGGVAAGNTTNSGGVADKTDASLNE